LKLQEQALQWRYNIDTGRLPSTPWSLRLEALDDLINRIESAARGFHEGTQAFRLILTNKDFS